MSPLTIETPYTIRDLVPMLGLSRGVISGLVSAGYVRPERGRRNEYRFSFQDVVLLRTAFELRAAQIPARRLLRALKQLGTQLPNEVPRSGLRITAVGMRSRCEVGRRSGKRKRGNFSSTLALLRRQGLRCLELAYRRLRKTTTPA